MKLLLSSMTAAAVIAFCGCSTPGTVSTMEGKGNRVVYNAAFDPTWRAAVDAAQTGDLEVISADPATGYISAKRGIKFQTFGENVGIWVTRAGPTQTAVEVVSKQAGPPVLSFKNWERGIQQAIAANLTREGIGGVPVTGGSVYGTSATVPVVVAPPAGVAVPSTIAPGSTVVTPVPSSTITVDTRDTQAELQRLQNQQLAREEELQREQDAKRRAEIQDDIDSLKRDMKKLQQRLNQLQQEQNALPRR